MAPAGYHLTSILLHAAAAGAFYSLAHALLLAARREQDSAWPARAGALFAALLFALHPLRVESVAWASERRDVLCGLFYLLTLRLYIGAKSPNAAKGLLPACVGTFALALLSKGMAISLPAILLVMDAYPLRRLHNEQQARPGKGWWRLVLEKWPFFVLAGIIAVIGLRGQLRRGASMELENFGIPLRLAQAAYGIVFYLKKTIIPIALSPFYQHNSFDPLHVEFLASGAVVILATALFVAARRRWPAGLAAWLCYAAILSPVLGLVPFGQQIAADRYTYIACLPWAVLAGAGLELLLRRNKTAGRAAALLAGLAIVLTSAFLTRAQISIWRDSESLWTQALLVQENNALAHNNLARHLAGLGRMDEALAHHGRAVELRPLDTRFRNNLGCALAESRRLREALAQFEEVLRIDPRHAEAMRNLEKARKLLAAAPSAKRTKP